MAQNIRNTAFLATGFISTVCFLVSVWFYGRFIEFVRMSTNAKEMQKTKQDDQDMEKEGVGQESGES
jgi:hypothetical protein